MALSRGNRSTFRVVSRWGFLLGIVLSAGTALAHAGEAPVAPVFNFEEASRAVPKPRELWPVVRQHCVPLEFKVLKDEIVPSDTDPTKKLRRVTAHFWSQELAGKKWGHACTILLPADNAMNQTPSRKGKVVLVGSPGEDYYPIHVAKYGEPIAARTGYPTMVLANPGAYPDGSDIEHDIGILGRLAKETGQNYYNMNCQLAVVYIQAMNALQQFLGLEELKAVVGGHSKRGRSATVAAAMDSRVASVIVMGNEGVYRTDRIEPHLSFHHAFFQEQVNVPVFYLGVTNEDGYRMFNINLLQERLRRPMTIELAPNYCHSNFSEIQFMDFLMWVAHVFDGRPITRIREVSHRREQNRSLFRAKIDSEATVQVVKAWYVYSDDPAWRDLMWYHVLMRRVGDYYEGALPGKVPDAFLVEVGDIAQGHPGYVSSLPQKLTDAPVTERVSRGSFPRLWSPEMPR
jgi:PhoPQ-activated pathogenicity-related protein